METWAATPEHWDAFSRLCLQDIFPTVNNPEIPLANPANGQFLVGKTLSKNPSQLNSEGKGYAMKWSGRITTPEHIAAWRKDNRDLGFGMRCATLKAMDFDIPDKEKSEELYNFVSDFFSPDTPIPYRARANSGSRMLVFRLVSDAERPRRGFTIATPFGNIEFKFDRQFAALSGRHHSGAVQVWPIGIPESMDEVPEIDDKGLDFLIAELQREYGLDPELSGNKYITALPKTRQASDAEQEQVEKMIALLQSRGEYKGMRADGAIGVVCPWQHLHLSTKGQPDADDFKTCVFPPGIGGFDDWGFKCMHSAGHGEKTFAEYAKAIGFVNDTGFELAPEPSEELLTRPAFKYVTKSGTPAIADNVRMGLQWEATGVRIVKDTFLGTILIDYDGRKSFREIKDEDLVEMKIRLEEKCDIRHLSTQTLREVVDYVAMKNEVDSAIEWGTSLRWDGVDRISSFHHEVLGAEDTPYHKSVVAYMFTALAGRLLSPGIKADMIPVFIGKQGCGKSTAIANLAPTERMYQAVNLSMKDDDLKRQLVGKSVVELSELSGLNRRAEEANKAWITTTDEHWIPKYKERAVTYARRWIAIGSSNVTKYLRDPTGARRWLPMPVAATRPMIDTQYIKDNCKQLWAQAIVMFRQEGVQFREAEYLAANEHAKYAVMTTEYYLINKWIKSVEQDGFSTLQVMTEVLNVPAMAPTAPRVKAEIENALLRLGYTEDDEGLWRLDFI